MPRSFTFENDFSAVGGVEWDFGDNMTWSVASNQLSVAWDSQKAVKVLSGVVEWSQAANLDAGGFEDHDFFVTCYGPTGGSLLARGGLSIGTLGTQTVCVREMVADDPTGWELIICDTINPTYTESRMSSLTIPVAIDYPVNMRMYTLDLNRTGQRLIAVKVWDQADSEPSWLNTAHCMVISCPVSGANASLCGVGVHDMASGETYKFSGPFTHQRLTVPHGNASFTLNDTGSNDTGPFDTNSLTPVINRPMIIALTISDSNADSITFDDLEWVGAGTMNIETTAFYDEAYAPIADGERRVVMWHAMCTVAGAGVFRVDNFSEDCSGVIIHALEFDGADATDADGGAAFAGDGPVTTKSDTNAVGATATLTGGFNSVYGPSSVYGHASHEENETSTAGTGWIGGGAMKSAHGGPEVAAMSDWDAEENTANDPSWPSSRDHLVMIMEVICHDSSADYVDVTFKPKMNGPRIHHHVRM